MVSIWPSLGKESKIFKEMQDNHFLFEQDHWCGGKVYDAFAPKAREIYWKHIQKGLAEKGVDAFWMDGTEPEFSSTDDQQITEKEILSVEKNWAGPAGPILKCLFSCYYRTVFINSIEITPAKKGHLYSHARPGPVSSGMPLLPGRAMFRQIMPT